MPRKIDINKHSTCIYEFYIVTKRCDYVFRNKIDISAIKNEVVRGVEQGGGECLKVEVLPNAIRFIVRATVSEKPTKFPYFVKWYVREYLETLPKIVFNGGLWTGGYICKTIGGGITEDDIKAYLYDVTNLGI